MAAGAAGNVALGQPAPTLTAHEQASISREPGSLQSAPTLIAHLQASIFGEAQEPAQQYEMILILDKEFLYVLLLRLLAFCCICFITHCLSLWKTSGVDIMSPYP